MKVAFLTRNLMAGGAERQLVLLARGLKERGHEVSVLTFYPEGELQADLLSHGVPIRCLEKRGRWDFLAFLMRLRKELGALRPDILHGYLDVPNMLVVLGKRFVPGAKAVWGIRASDMDLKHYDPLWSVTHGMAVLLSRAADLIIVNSYAGFKVHEQRGFSTDRMRVVPNGINTQYFCPNGEGRTKVRAEWAVDPASVLVGMVGRSDPMKDHQTFVKAAARLHRSLPEARFVCVGVVENECLNRAKRLSEAEGIGQRIKWVGRRSDMRNVYNALDLLVLPSAFGEGFPNAVGEAMACGVPCVVTDVGDSARIVADLGEVAAPGDANGLSEACARLITRMRADATLSSRARQRILDEYSLSRLIDMSEQALTGLLC